MIVDAGFTVHLPILAELKCAWWEDFREVLYAIGKDVANPEALGLFGIRRKGLKAMKRRIFLGLNNTLSDTADAAENGGYNLSYSDGLGAVLSLARILLPSKSNTGWDKVKDLHYQIDGCIIALVVRGEMQHVADLIRLACCVSAINDALKSASEPFRSGCSHRHSDNLNKLQLLLDLDVYLQRSVIPTKFRLREDFPGKKKAPEFSDILKGMKIKDLLPDESRERKPPGHIHKGSALPAVIRSGAVERPKKHREAELPNQSVDEAGDRDDDTFVIALHEEWSASDPAIRNIRKNLGSLYPLLLIESEMDELKDGNDLREFERRLSERGLRLS